MCREGRCIMHEPLAEELRRMEQVPGISFSSEVGGRKAQLQGTGLAVWGVVRLYGGSTLS